jgi:F-type H+-transporting ATPase subunit b
MRARFAILLTVCWVAWAPAGFSQVSENAAENAGKTTEKTESFAERHELELKWANFLLLAGVLGYMIGKNAGPFFAARSSSIRKDLDESEQKRQDAEVRAAAVDARLADLGKEIAALRGQSQAQSQVENERMAQHTAAEIAKIQAHAEQEIASAGKAARMDLKRYSAQLAVELAEKKIRDRITPETQSALVRGFVRDLAIDLPTGRPTDRPTDRQ